MAVFNNLSVAWVNRLVGLHTCFYGLDNLAYVHRGCDTVNEYENKVFNGKCPYTDKPCTDKIPCNICQMNEEEKRLMDLLDEQERQEIWEEEMR